MYVAVAPVAPVGPVAPSIPSSPSAPVEPVSPFGITKSKTALRSSPLFVTWAGVFESPVVTDPT